MYRDSENTEFVALLQSAGHVLELSPDGSVDFFAHDIEDYEMAGGHNGPRCSACGEVWCEWCDSEEAIERCAGK